MSRCVSLCLLRRRTHIVFRACVSLFVMAFIVGLAPIPTTLEQINQRGFIRVVTLAQDGSASALTLNHSFSGEITQLFAQHMGLPVHIEAVSSLSVLAQRLEHNQADIALTSMLPSSEHFDNVHYSQTYEDLSFDLIRKTPASAEDQSIQPEAMLGQLKGARLAVYAGSSEDQLAQTLREQVPTLHIERVPQSAQFSTLLDMVAWHEADFALVDADTFSEHRLLHRNLQVVTQLTHAARMAWNFAPGTDSSLHAQAGLFLDQLRRNGTLDRLAMFYRPEPHNEASDAHGFYADLRNRLPVFANLFQHYASQMGLDWHMIAAIAYQESRWQPHALASSGAAGMMMLMSPTASELGVKDRTNANQSIRAGCAYFKSILDTLPADVHEPDRSWMALAAYNMGPGFLRRARVMTRQHHRNPDLWVDVRQSMTALLPGHGGIEEDGTPSGQVLAYVHQVQKYYDALLLAHPDRFQEQIAER